MTKADKHLWKKRRPKSTSAGRSRSLPPTWRNSYATPGRTGCPTQTACIVHGLVALNFEANRAISERYHKRQRIMYEVSPTRRYYYLQWKGPDQKEWELDSYMPALHVELIQSVLDRQELVDAMQKWMAPRGCSSLRVSA